MGTHPYVPPAMPARDQPLDVPNEVANLTLPTTLGEWRVRAFEWSGGVHLCLCR